jgi:hypothetical protein
MSATTTERAWGPARCEVPAGAWRVDVVFARERESAERPLFSAGQVLVGCEHLRLPALLPTLTVVLHRLLKPLVGQLRVIGFVQQDALREAVEADAVLPVRRYEIATTLTVGPWEWRRWHRFAVYGRIMPPEVEALVERIALQCVEDGAR